MFEPGCNFDERGMTIWEFEHFKRRVKSKSEVGDHRFQGLVRRNSSSTHRRSSPRLGVDGIRLGHIARNQVRCRSGVDSY